MFGFTRVSLPLRHVRCTLNARLTRTSSAAADAKEAKPHIVASAQQPSRSQSHSNATPLPLHPTLQLIAQRNAEGSHPANRNDPFKLGLVVEGGGMRGVISGAMLMALRSLGLRDAFDAVYGASAGAINATYFITGQSHGLDIYTEDLVDGRFLDLSALLLPSYLRQWAPGSASFSAAAGPGAADGSGGLVDRPAMDLSYLLDHVMQQVKPLDWASVLSSPLPLKVVASSLDELRPIVFDSFLNELDLVECLYASATVPEIAGPPRLVRGHYCVDAAVFEPVPIGSALADGCTHVLVLCTRTAAAAAAARRSGPVGKAASRAMETVMKQTFLNAAYMREAWRSSRSHKYKEHDEALYDAFHGCAHASHRQLGAFVLPVYPGSSQGVHPVCTDVRKLSAARFEGYNAVDRIVGRPLGMHFESGTCAATWQQQAAAAAVKQPSRSYAAWIGMGGG